MRSQLRFVMHAGDEQVFSTQCLSDDSVVFIDGPRWKESRPQTHRSLDRIAGDYCIIWSTRDRAALQARYIAACNDWYCASEFATIQFLRSRGMGSVVTEGRLAINTTDAGADEAEGVERRFRSLIRVIKRHYTNAVVQWLNPGLPLAPASATRSANPGKPDAQVWVGPHALQWLRDDRSRRVKQFAQSVVEARLVE